MRRPLEHASRSSRDRAGQVLIEFAGGAGVMLTLFAGTFWLGYTFIQYNRLQSAVAQGARYASLVPYDSASPTPSERFLLAVRNVAVYGNPVSGGTPALRGLAPENVNLSVTFANGVPHAMTVWISGYTIGAVFRATTLTTKPRATYLYQGIWAPY
jgi:Flp pilus assembly protein TadG